MELTNTFAQKAVGMDINEGLMTIHREDLSNVKLLKKYKKEIIEMYNEEQLEKERLANISSTALED